jgi:hypothetical protein
VTQPFHTCSFFQQHQLRYKNIEHICQMLAASGGTAKVEGLCVRTEDGQVLGLSLRATVDILFATAFVKLKGFCRVEKNHTVCVSF